MTTSTPTAAASSDGTNGSTFRQRWLLSPNVAWRAARVSLAAVCYSALAALRSLSLDLGVWSLPPLAVGIYFLVALELTAEAIEDPFGVEDDDLPLERYCQSIESFVKQALGESPAA